MSERSERTSTQSAGAHAGRRVRRGLWVSVVSWRAARRFILVALALPIFLIGSGAAANAAPADCVEPPVATAPSEQAPAVTLGAGAAQDPTGEDPFEGDAKTTVYREYGWPSTWWAPYDLGCGAQMANDPIAVLSTFFGNLLALGVLVGGSLFDVVAHSTIGWSGLGFVDGGLESIVADLRGQVWLPTMTLVAIAAALWFVLHSVRGDSKKVALAAGWSVVAVLLVATMVSYPTKSAQVFDAAVGSAVTTAYGTSAISGADGRDGSAVADDAISAVYDVVVYDRWCEGMVGSGEEVRARWCPRLWKATFLSATEARASGSALATLIDRKKQEFDTVAAEIKEDDPGAYRVLQGKDWSGRVVAAGVGSAVLLALVLFPLSAAVVLLVALLMLRAAVFLAPVLGPVMIHPSAQRAGRSVLRLLGGAAVNAAVFAFASAVYLRIAVEVLGATGTPLLLRMVVLVVLTAALWVITRPWRRLTGLGRGMAATIGGRSGSGGEGARRGGAEGAARGSTPVSATVQKNHENEHSARGHQVAEQTTAAGAVEDRVHESSSEETHEIRTADAVTPMTQALAAPAERREPDADVVDLYSARERRADLAGVAAGHGNRTVDGDEPGDLVYHRPGHGEVQEH